MKINAFNMIAYGPFTNKTIDMSGIANGLHIIYGRNEAGKSTSLRALIAFLYGFEHRVQDDWLHRTSKLAVGGTLVLGDGRRVSLTRYKRRKNDLINNDTDQPIEQSFLDQYLVSKSEFQNAYGISHEALRRGVETVLTSGGELGQTLFTATSGLNLLKSVLASLDEKQKELFSPRAQKAVINNGISQLSELHKKVRQVSAKPNDWKHKKKELEELEKNKEQIDTRSLALNQAISADARVRDAIKFIPQLYEVEKELAVLSTVTILPDDFHQRRVQAQVSIEESRKARDILNSELQDIAERMKLLGFNENIIASRARIEALADDIKVYRKEVADSKTLRARIHEADRRTQTALQHLRIDFKLEEIDDLRLPKPAENELRRLAQAHALLEQKKKAAEKELTEAVPQIVKIQDKLIKLGKARQTQGLQSCLSRVSDYGKLDVALSDIQTETNTLNVQIQKDLAGLGIWAGDLATLETMSIPPEETIRRYEKDLAQGRDNLAAVKKEIRRLDQAIMESKAEYEEKTSARKLPAPEDLQRRRDLRDQGWRSVRTVWLNGGEPDHQFLSAFPDQPALADAYQQSVKDADETADLLRIEAGAVAIAQRLRKEIEGLEKQVQEQLRQQQNQQQQQQERLGQWRGIWQPLGIDPYPPSEMLEWCRKVETIKRATGELRQKLGKKDQMQALIKSFNEEISSSLTKLNVKIFEKISHGALVDLARSIVKQNEELREQRKAMAFQLDELTKRKDEAQKAIDQSDKDMGRWLNRWQAALGPLKLPASTEPEIALEFLDEIKGIIFEYDDAHKNQSRIDAMERNRRDFQKRVQEAAADLAPQLADYEPDRAAETLKILLLENIDQQRQYKHLDTDQRERKDKLTKEQKKAAGNNEFLRQLCIEACAADPEQLPDIETRSKRKADLLTKEKTIKDRLSELAAGHPLQAFIDHVRLQNPDAIAAALEKNEQEKSDLQDRHETLVAGIALAQADLKKFDGQSQAAGLAVEADGLSGRLQTEVEHYVKLHIASQILTRAIERYRKENESPILEAASSYFKIMTQGTFSGLKADFDDKGNPVIKAVRTSDDMPLAIEQMSDGSRDQLFLSLRLGGLSRHLDANGGMPFIVDDVLVNFDDDRAAAALKALSELAGRTQIVFFTHHKHLVELAEKAVPHQLLSTYSL